MKSNNPIGFFDSGVGQLSVLLEVKKFLPWENYVIFADQVHNPYGDKSEAQIKRYTKEATAFLIRKHQIKMMVLACNTATVLALSYLRENFDIPIVGTVPAVKSAYNKSKKLKVAVMSTPATAKSKYLDDLVQKFENGAGTLKIGCYGLEEAIEVLDNKKIDKLIKTYTKKIKDFGADVVVLGCTHYPLIKTLIQKQLRRTATIIDSGRPIARHIRQVLENNKELSKKKHADIYYTTGSPQLFARVASKFLKHKITAQKLMM